MAVIYIHVKHGCACTAALLRLGACPGVGAVALQAVLSNKGSSWMTGPRLPWASNIPPQGELSGNYRKVLALTLDCIDPS